MDWWTMKKAEQIRTIDAAYRELGQLNLQDGFWNVRERLFDMNEAAEKQHRSGRPRQPLTITAAARLFTVKHLLDGFAEPDKWTVDAILHIRNEVLYAQAYAKKHHAELAGWAVRWTEPFESVDYAKLMEGIAA
jgi:hypothetical protein